MNKVITANTTTSAIPQSGSPVPGNMINIVIELRSQCEDINFTSLSSKADTVNNLQAVINQQRELEVVRSTNTKSWYVEWYVQH